MKEFLRPYLVPALLILLGILLIWLLCRKVRTAIAQLHKKKYLQEVGRKGEEALEAQFASLSGYHKILSNVYIPTARSTTEIDLIMLHHTGIYVVENKSYSGWIFGSEENKYWLQTFPNGDKMNFYNPILQNDGHIASLMKYLGRKDREHFHSIIIFSDRCTFKELHCRHTDAWLIHNRELKRTIRRAGRKTKYALTRSEIREIYKQLLPCTKVSKQVKRDHLKTVKKKK